jgi:hypothetical protein
MTRCGAYISIDCSLRSEKGYLIFGTTDFLSVMFLNQQQSISASHRKPIKKILSIELSIYIKNKKSV